MSRSQTSRGQSGPDTQSPRLIVRSTSRLLDVGEHSFERRHIAVYIGDDGDPHWITCGLPSCEQPFVLSSSVPLTLLDPIRFSSPAPILSLHS